MTNTLALNWATISSGAESKTYGAMPPRSMYTRGLTLFRLSVFVFTVAITARVHGQSSPCTAHSETPDRALLGRAIDNQKKNDAALDVYERIERVEIRRRLRDAQPPQVKVSRVIPAGTGMHHIPLGPDGKPSDAAAYRAELEKLERALALIVDGARSQHEGLEKYARRRKERNDMIEAARSAFLFTFIACEPRDARILLKYRMDPNPAFKPTTRSTSFYTRIRGTLWIDEANGQLARIEGEVIDDISLGIFLASVYKGSHFMQDRYEMAPGLWLPTFSEYDFDGRRFFMNFSLHERTFYSNYRFIGPPREALRAIRAELGTIPRPVAGP